jgi:predicted PurR-regulated permease PerM
MPPKPDATPPAAPSGSNEERALTLRLLRVLLYVALLALAWRAVSELSLVLAPVCVALVVAFLLDPSVRALEKRRVPRWLAVVLLGLTLLSLLAGVAVTVPYLVQKEIERFTEQLPAYQLLINTKLVPFLGKVFKYRAHSIGELVRLSSTQLTDWVRGAAGQISQALGTALVGVAGFFRYLIAVLLVPFFAASFLMDMPKLGAQIKELVPPRYQETTAEIVHDVYIALGGWLRGQLTVMVIQAALYSIGLSVAGIPLAILIGCTAGFLAFVPYVGVSIGFLAAVLAALLEVGTRGATPILAVMGVFGAVQLLDAVLITPRAVGGRIGLSAVGVIFALSLGGTLFGYAGLLMAVPLAAVLKALWPRLLGAYAESDFYRGRRPNAPPPVLPPPSAAALNQVIAPTQAELDAAARDEPLLGDTDKKLD